MSIPEELKGHLDYALKNAAEYYNCKVEDLECKIKKNGDVSIIQVGMKKCDIDEKFERQFLKNRPFMVEKICGQAKKC